MQLVQAIHLVDRWVEVEELASVLRLFERDVLPGITHGMCPDCHADMSALIDD